ncbi:unnamed protein product [Urochloa humidicola]
MDSMEEMMKKLQLSAAESKGIKIGGGGLSKGKGATLQAVGKVFAERLVNAEGLAQALGRIWCPMRGVGCKDLGENHFLFTFHQAGGKRRALEDGPWMSGKDLVVMVDYDAAKTLEEMVFAHIPIWVRVFKLPFGLMHKATGKAIGGELGEFMEMDNEEDGTAVGRFLRIKVRLDIRKPLMRGVTVQVENEKGEGQPKWCPLVYEFLPDFCYTCGIIGHTDKVCDIKLKKDEVQQFGPALRFIPEKRRMEEGGGDRALVNRSGWKMGGSGSRGSWGSGSRSWQSGAGSDAPSWRKKDTGAADRREKKGGEDDEVTSPEKIVNRKREDGEAARRVLQLEDNGKKELPTPAITKTVVAIPQVKETSVLETGVQAQGNVNSSLQTMQFDHKEEEVRGKEVMMSKGGEKKEDGRKKGTYRKTNRARDEMGTIQTVKEVVRKRSAHDVEMETVGGVSEEEGKRDAAANKKAKLAGLADQSCGSQ